MLEKYEQYQWRRNRSGCSGFGRYASSPILIFSYPYLRLSSLLDATSLENDSEVVFGMHETR